jgi:hypothetical protein
MSTASKESKEPPPPLRHANPPLQRMGPVPRISRLELAGIGAGLLFAVVAPTFVVLPGSTGMRTGQVVGAVLLTVLGVLIAMTLAALAFRRTRNYAWLIIGFVPSFTLLVGAAIMAAVTSGT